MEDQDIYFDKLSALVLNGEKRSTVILPLIGHCIISMNGRLKRVDKQVNGNGKGIGIADEIASVKLQIKNIEAQLQAVCQKKDSDVFKRMLTWLADKVLPSLITTAILGVIGWWWAINNLLIKAP